MALTNKTDRKEYNKQQYLMRKRRADNKLIQSAVIEPSIIIIEPAPEPAVITIEIQIINKYKECLEMQRTHNDLMLWITTINLVNEQFILRATPHLLDLQ